VTITAFDRTTILRNPKLDNAPCTAVRVLCGLRETPIFAGTATVVISTGNCSVQCYGTPDDLRDLAAALLQAADVTESASQGVAA
jgi:hypothetical protein